VTFTEDTLGAMKDLSVEMRHRIAQIATAAPTEHGLQFDTAKITPEGHWFVCTVCVRDTTRDSERWSWLACRECMDVDREAAALLGAHATLPLGRHSIMNRVGIRLDATDGQRVAGIDQLLGMGRAWELLSQWRIHEVLRLRSNAGLGGKSVPWGTWSTLFPASRDKSESAYARLITTTFPSWFGISDEYDDWVLDRLPYRGRR
jgi:hypothetical protein